MVTWHLLSSQRQRSYPRGKHFSKTTGQSLTSCPLCWKSIRENEIKWTRKTNIRKTEFLVVGEACRAIFWHTQGYEKGTLESSEFSAGGPVGGWWWGEGVLISASAASNSRGYFCAVNVNSCVLVCTLSDDQWQQDSQFPALRYLGLIPRGTNYHYYDAICSSSSNKVS